MTAALLEPLDTRRVSGVCALHDAIETLRGVAGRTDPSGYDDLLVDLEREERRLRAIKLEVVAAAEAARIADRTGLADTSSWFAQRTRSSGGSAAAEVALATALAPTPERPTRPCADALSAGDLSAAHAQVIVRATAQLPSTLSSAEVARVETELVAKAAALAPDQLRRAARRALAAVEEDQATLDRHEDHLLRTEEHAALSKTRLTWHDNGDGTTSGHFTVPTLAASILTRVIQSMTAPRRAHLGAPAAQAGDPTTRRDWAHQSGLAFVELLEHLPTDHLHSRVAATVVVTIDHGRLAAAVGAAHLDTNDALSAGDLRRLACSAGILPAVLDGASLPLDLGRSSRLFTETQRVALATRHTTCAADGCERPYAWCELHHEVPWSRGGRTDLADAVPLCGFHHRRIHDHRYEHRRGPRGITYTQRT